jgi:hypothetical protein
MQSPCLNLQTILVAEAAVVVVEADQVDLLLQTLSTIHAVAYVDRTRVVLISVMAETVGWAQ